MYDRLSGYYAGREPLPSMAYFCLTVFLSPFSGNRNVRRTAASAHYHIDKQVLDEIGDLSSEKGGPDSARKVGAMGSALSRKEERFLEAARVQTRANHPPGCRGSPKPSAQPSRRSRSRRRRPGRCVSREPPPRGSRLPCGLAPEAAATEGGVRADLERTRPPSGHEPSHSQALASGCPPQRPPPPGPLGGGRVARPPGPAVRGAAPTHGDE